MPAGRREGTRESDCARHPAAPAPARPRGARQMVSGAAWTQYKKPPPPYTGTQSSASDVFMETTENGHKKLALRMESVDETISDADGLAGQFILQRGPGNGRAGGLSRVSRRRLWTRDHVAAGHRRAGPGNQQAGAGLPGQHRARVLPRMARRRPGPQAARPWAHHAKALHAAHVLT